MTLGLTSITSSSISQGESPPSWPVLGQVVCGVVEESPDGAQGGAGRLPGRPVVEGESPHTPVA